jgi:hypothetical protein
MISLETAKKLKEAGLKWKPKTGDWGYNAYRGLFLIHYPHPQYAIQSSYIYAPRLDQMLAEIEKLGYAYRVTGKWGIEPYKITVIKEKPLLDFNSWGYSPEEATAQALIWILEQEVTP